MAEDKINYEIIVVQDGISEVIYEHLRMLSTKYGFSLYQTEGTCGYTKTINEGIKKAGGDLIFLLNDDICFEQQDWLKLMLKTFQLSPQVGIVGCRLLYPDRRIQHGGMYYIGSLQLLAHKHWGENEHEEAAQRVHHTVALTGAVLAVKGDVIKSIGLLNPDFTILCSDTDYCLTAHEKGWQVIYNGRAYTIHHESQTRKQYDQKKLSRLEAKDLLLFFRKWSEKLKYMHVKGFI